jgi:diaminopimelate epimerase
MFFFLYYHQKTLEFSPRPDTNSSVVVSTNQPHKVAVVDNVELMEALKVEAADRKQK